MVKECLHGVQVNDRCLHEKYEVCSQIERTYYSLLYLFQNLSDEDKVCFCGGIQYYSEMLTLLETILCDGQEQKRQGHLFFPNEQENFKDLLVGGIMDLFPQPEAEAKLHPVIRKNFNITGMQCFTKLNIA